jgi:hypothetical protein
MVGRGWSKEQIKLTCAAYAATGLNDPDVKRLIDSAFEKFGRTSQPSNDQPETETAAELPAIRIAAGHEDANAIKAQEILIADGAEIFQYVGKLMRPIVEETDASDGRKTTTVRMKQVTTDFLNLELCRHIRYEKFDGRKKQWLHIRPDKKYTTADILAEEGRWLFANIMGVITSPTLRPDGSILSTPGYDEKTGLLLLAPPAMPFIPDNPTREDALAALQILKVDLLSEFPFVVEDDGKSISQAVGLSAIITPIVRGAFAITPAHCANSAVSGSGKSFFMDTVSVIATGREMPVMAVVGDEKETAKEITATLVSGQSLMSLDNVNGELGGDTLCKAIERPRIVVRPFGKNTETIEVEVRGTSIFMTGNNLILVGDLNRRVLTAVLDPRMEQPELRKFKGNPVRTVLEDRGRYIAACLTICRAYAVAGRPGKADPLASYEGWSDTVRSALIWLGEADPVKSIQNIRREDPERVRLQNMLTAWADLFGSGYDNRKSLAAARRVAEQRFDNNNPSDPDLAQALLDAMLAVAIRPGDAGGVDINALGKWLRGNKGKIVDGYRFVNTDKGGTAQWYVEKV